MSAEVARLRSTPVRARQRERRDVDVEQLVTREGPSLLDYFGRRVDQPADAADLLGDTLVVVWRRRSAIPVDATEARMWLFGVARRVLATHRRGKNRRQDLAERLRRELAHVPPERSGSGDDLHEQVRQLVGALNEVDREIIGLVYWEGFTLVDVARIMSMRPATIRSRHARARARLHAELRQAGEIADFR